MLRQSRPRYIMIYLYLFWQYHRSFISIEIETTRKNNLPKQNFKHLQNMFEILVNNAHFNYPLLKHSS